MKKGFMFGLVLMLVVFAGFVVADLNYQEGDIDNIDFKVYLHEGWNLVGMGLFTLRPTESSDIQLDDIGAIYYYSNRKNSYMNVHPNLEEEGLQEELYELDRETREMNYAAAWVYSGREGYIEFETDDVVPVGDRILREGWNFVSISKDMFKGNFVANGDSHDGEYFSWEEIKGTCDIEKVYFWMPPTQEWDEWSSFRTSKIKGYDFDEFLGGGFIVKIADDCKLSAPDGDGPPALPGVPGVDTIYEDGMSGCTDNDGGKNYYVKGTFSGLWDGSQITNTDSCVDALDETGDNVPSSNYLGEGYCENNQLKVERIICPNGCEDGACVEDSTSLRQDIEDYYYSEFAYEACDLNEANEYTSVIDCEAAWKCLAEEYAKLIPEADLKNLADNMKANGGESASIYYNANNPSVNDAIVAKYDTCLSGRHDDF